VVSSQFKLAQGRQKALIGEECFASLRGDEKQTQKNNNRKESVMAIDYRMIAFGFGPVTGREQELVGKVPFGGPVLRAETALQGFDSRFQEGDHHVHAHKIDTGVDRIEDSIVYVKVRYLLRDSSGDIDDPYWGAVWVLVIADVAPPKLRLPTLVRAKGSTLRRKRSKT
jgi:hypothetical protein